MATSSKTFIPDGTWTYGGDVSLVSSEAKLTANLTYDADNGGANIDLSAQADGTSLTGWTTVAGTLTKETSTVPIIQLVGSWGGAHVTTTTLDNGAVQIKLRGAGRWNPFMRWTSGVQSGYVNQILTSQMQATQKLGVALSSFFDGTKNSSITFAPTEAGLTPAVGVVCTLNTYTETGGEVRHTAYNGAFKWADRIDDELQDGAGLFGLQSFGTLQTDYFKVYTMATGTASTGTLTPDSVTTWGEITINTEGLGVAMQDTKLSSFLEYKMIGGTPSPSVFTAVPDDGDISAATGDSIEVKATIDNRYAAHTDAFIHSIGIKLNDGTWTAAASAATLPTSLAVQSTAREQATLTWVDGSGNSTNELYFNTADNSSTATFFGLVPQGTQVGTITGLTAGTVYYFWIKGRASDDSVSAFVGSVTGTTAGASGIAGTNVVEQIRDAMNTRVSTVLGTDYKKLEYIRAVEKNSAQTKAKGYGVIVGEAEPAEESINRSFTFEHDFIVVLCEGVERKNNERDQETAALTLATAMNSIYKDFQQTRLGLPAVVIQVEPPTIEEREISEDGGTVVLRGVFPLIYRQAFR